jgi:hypothetical protein
MPLLLQIGFGLSPFESGSLTFAAAAGAMAMKFTASRLLKRFGFRTGAGRQRGAFGGLPRLLRLFIGAQTPHWLIFMAAADRRLLPLARIHRAQRDRLRRHFPGAHEPRHQLRQRLAADVVSASASRSRRLVQRLQWGFGDATLAPRDMQLSFFVVAAVSAASVLIFLRLKPDAGAEVSGRAVAAAAVEPPQTASAPAE